MTWKLFLDDQWQDKEMPFRNPPSGFIPAANCAEAIALVYEFGVPEFMDLDHDLGDGKDAMHFLKELELYNCLSYERKECMKSVPAWKVHSMNPVGRDNINAFMKAWARDMGDNINISNWKKYDMCSLLIADIEETILQWEEALNFCLHAPGD
jgi:hypothetical protein